MAVSSGFFNSVEGDRLYNADTMSEYFEGLISQGVFENVGDRMQVTAGAGMSVNVGSGRAIVKTKWCKNDSALNLAITAADLQKNRIDAIAVRFDASARAVSVVVKEGTATTGTATPPSRATGADVYELFLAYVNVPKNTSAITQALITDLRSSDMCGWVTGIIEQVDTSDLFAQWQAAYENYYASATAAFNAYIAAKQAEFEAWFDDLTEQLRVDTTIKKYQQTWYLGDGVSEIPVGIEQYTSDDILLAFVNGVLLDEGTEYTISGTGSTANIILTRALIGTNVASIIVIKSVVGGSPVIVSRNIMPSAEAGSETSDSLTVTCDGEGRYHIEKTGSGDKTVHFDLPAFTIPVSVGSGGNGTISFFNTMSSSAMVSFENNGSSLDSWQMNSTNRQSDTYTTLGGTICNRIKFECWGDNWSGDINIMITDDGELPTEFEPSRPTS